MICTLKDDIRIYSEALELRRSILCIICLENYSDPVVLPCSHTFCRPCILEAFNSKKKCPLCSAETSKRCLQSSTFIQPVVKAISELTDSLTTHGRYSIQDSVLKTTWKKDQEASDSQQHAHQSLDLQFKSLDQNDSIENKLSDEIQYDHDFLISNEFEKPRELRQQQSSTNLPNEKSLPSSSHYLQTSNLSKVSQISHEQIKENQNNRSSPDLIVIESNEQKSNDENNQQLLLNDHLLVNEEQTNLVIEKIVYKPGEVVQVLPRTWPGQIYISKYVKI